MRQPYPSHLVSSHVLPNGQRVTVRPIRPEDARIEQEFVSGLSPEAKYFRFMNAIRELTPRMLARFTRIDYDREMALIAVREESGVETEIAVARYVAAPEGASCEFAVVVADGWQQQGLGRLLLTRLMEIARSHGFTTMTGDILTVNRPMLALAASLGFTIAEVPGDPRLRCATIELAAHGPCA